MATEKIIRIMRSKGAPFPDELLERMSDHECWQWIYSNPNKPKTRAPKPKPSKTVCFTGFRREREQELTLIAASHGWRILETPGKSMSHLCTGESPGPKKLEKAQLLGAFIIPETEFLKLLQKETR